MRSNSHPLYLKFLSESTVSWCLYSKSEKEWMEDALGAIDSLQISTEMQALRGMLRNRPRVEHPRTMQMAAARGMAVVPPAVLDPTALLRTGSPVLGGRDKASGSTRGPADLPEEELPAARRRRVAYRVDPGQVEAGGVSAFPLHHIGNITAPRNMPEVDHHLIPIAPQVVVHWGPLRACRGPRVCPSHLWNPARGRHGCRNARGRALHADCAGC